MAIVPTAVGGSTYFLLKDMQFTISAGSLPYSLLANKKYNFFATFFCFFSLVACSFKEKEKKPRKFSVCVALGLIQDAVSTPSLFCLFACWGVYQMPSLSHHRAGCCECFPP